MVRITTGMLNETARQAGFPVNNTSLLNYVNNNSNNLSLLDALNKNKIPAASSQEKENYEKLGNAGEKLTNAVNILQQTGEKDIFAKAREEGSTENICKTIQSVVKQYNSLLDSLKSNSNTLNQYYERMMKALPAEHKEALASIGITQSKDGRLTVDAEKLEAADVDTLENIWGEKSDLSERLGFLANRISDNAYANAKSAATQYNSDGNIYSFMKNQMNLWG